MWILLAGVSLLAGVGVVAIAIPINSVIAARFQKLQVQQMKEKDERVKLMNEALNGIKVLNEMRQFCLLSNLKIGDNIIAF